MQTSYSNILMSGTSCLNSCQLANGHLSNGVHKVRVRSKRAVQPWQLNPASRTRWWPAQRHPRPHCLLFVADGIPRSCLILLEPCLHFQRLPVQLCQTGNSTSQPQSLCWLKPPGWMTRLGAKWSFCCYELGELCTPQDFLFFFLYTDDWCGYTEKNFYVWIMARSGTLTLCSWFSLLPSACVPLWNLFVQIYTYLCFVSYTCKQWQQVSVSLMAPLPAMTRKLSFFPGLSCPWF